MTPWEFEACVAGYNAAHGSHKSKATAMSDDDYDALCALGDKWNSEVANAT